MTLNRAHLRGRARAEALAALVALLPLVAWLGLPVQALPAQAVATQARSAPGLPVHALPAQDGVAHEIRQRIEQLRATGYLDVGGVRITRSGALAGLYEQRGFAPLWTDPAACADLLSAVVAMEDDGLVPAHYHLETIRSLAVLARAPSAALSAELDLLRSDALLRMAAHLRHGKAPEQAPATAVQPAIDAAVAMIGSGRPGAAVLRLRPSHFVYVGLVEALAALRAIDRAGGWPVLPPGPAMRRDSEDPRVPLLRQRLRLAGDLAQPAASPAAPTQPADPGELRFDAELERAVVSFQHRHGLNEDGVVGAATLAELNVPVTTRIRQLRVNLERARWVTHDLEDTFVAVNIAGAMAYLVRDGDVVFETRVVVGRTSTRTPVFSAPMRYIDLNPTWTVPPGIVGEVLSSIRRDAHYLQRNAMRVLDSGGRAVDPARIDFSRYSGRTFPYVFRQDPGPVNPLGRIKFMFPNRHNVYLHDTPARHLFDHEERLFSHGCIRVRDPLRLAELLLEGSDWSRTALDAAIATGRTRTIMLSRPVPVLVLYWTASADLHGELHFYRDVYGRDQAVLDRLDGRLTAQ